MSQGPKGERHPRDVIGNAVHVMRIARVQSSRRLECEASRWREARSTALELTGASLVPH